MRARNYFAWLLTIVLVLTTLAGCTAAQSLPPSAGQYGLQPGSVCVDGDRFRVLWVDQDSGIHQGELRNPAVVRDERNYLEVGADRQVVALHLRDDEQIVACTNRASDTRTGWTTWVPIPIPVGGSSYDGPTTNAPSSGGPTISRPADNDRDPLAKPS
ncbi:MAG: hypothetical protein ACYC4L_11225, partial [Chloroflexota bacterium]